MFETIKEFWLKARLRKAELKLLANTALRKKLNRKHESYAAKVDKLREKVRAY